MSEYDTANEHVLCFQIGKLKRRIADLSQAVGLITTLKPTMVMDVDHPLDMAKEVVEHVTARIAELEAERRWIPVSEPPTVCRDKYGEFIPYLVCTHRGEYPFRAFWDGTMWGDGVRQVFVTHWMPLPELPEVQE